MKILIIGLDKRALDLNSSTGQRLKDYASLVEKLEVVVLGAYSKNKALSFFKAIRRARDILRMDPGGWVISTQDPFFIGLAGYILKKLTGVLLHVQVHIDFYSVYFWRESFQNKIHTILAKFILPRSDGIRVVSQKIKDYLTNELGMPNSKITVLPIRTEVGKIIKAVPKIDLHQKYPQFKFIMLVASRLVKQKNIGLAISSMSEIVSMHPEAGLLIVGSGPEENNLKFKIKNLKLNNNIIFEPWSDDLFSYYKTCDLFLLPSYYEGWGRTAIEAMAAGCPVIMSDVGLANETLIPEYNGVVVPVNNKDKLKNAILRLVEDPALREKLINNAAKTVNELPKKEEYLKEYLRSWQNCFR